MVYLSRLRYLLRIQASGLLHNSYCVLCFGKLLVFSVLVPPSEVLLCFFLDGLVIRIVAVVDYKLFKGSKMTLDSVHPRSVCRDEDEFDVVLAAPKNDV